MQSQINRTEILTKVKKCHKNISKLNNKLDILDTLMKKQNFDIEKNTDVKKQKATENPVIIIHDETSLEIIIDADDPQQEQAVNVKEIARKLISRFYYHIKQKMRRGSINQVQALKQFYSKDYNDDLYQKLHQGLLKLYFEKDQKCKECHQTIQDQQTCLSHIRNEHLNDLQIYICLECKSSFSKEDQLEKHNQQEHNQFQTILQNQKETNVHQSQSKLLSIGNIIQHNFNQKLDLNKIVQDIQPQPILKKILVSQLNNTKSLRSSSDEAKQSMPVLNQVYIPVDLNKGDIEENQEQNKNIGPYVTKKPSKLKIKFIQVQKNDKTQKN
ncbi:unnamed protein product [Paramecium sonneborni]|uniref:C2H2-type domain-containing protein n=1 Tax=Paramecium sonneborni TaxID=65129 RepID=A0A8S1NF85_9CILI|nr:unnamed protein product [Paramecium sonneborni]